MKEQFARPGKMLAPLSPHEGDMRAGEWDTGTGEGATRGRRGRHHGQSLWGDDLPQGKGLAGLRGGAKRGAQGGEGGAPGALAPPPEPGAADKERAATAGWLRPREQGGPHSSLRRHAGGWTSRTPARRPRHLRRRLSSVSGPCPRHPPTSSGGRPTAGWGATPSC